MKKLCIFLSVGLCVFVLLIFQSSFCWATTSYQLDIDLSSMNGSGTLCLDVPDDTYKYVVVLYRATESNKYSVYISDIPFYYSSERIGTSMRGNFYLVGNSEGNFYYYNYYSTSASSSNVYSVDGGSTSTYGYSAAVTDYVSNVYSNYIIYTDDTYSVAYTNNILSVDSTYTNVDFSSSDNNSDYTDVLNHIDEQVTSTNTIVDNIDNTTQSIDNRVYQIQVILQDNLSQNQVTNAITSTSAETQNLITSTSSNTQNQIEQSRVQSQTQFNTITNTTDYDSAIANIDTSSYQVEDVNHIDSFISTIYSTIYNFFNDLDVSNSVDIVIPIPFTNQSMTLSTASIQNFYSQHTILSNLITIFWYFTFGLYIFRLAYSLYIAAVTGVMLDNTHGLWASLDEGNLVKYLML